jgi:hypothetical protein
MQYRRRNNFRQLSENRALRALGVDARRHARGFGTRLPGSRVYSLAIGIERYIDCFATALTRN